MNWDAANQESMMVHVVPSLSLPAKNYYNVLVQFLYRVSFYRIHKGLSRECDFQHRVFKGYSCITSI